MKGTEDVENSIQQVSIFKRSTICWRKFSTEFAERGDSIEPSEPTTHRKLLKVAILGRPNAGKSTLINSILGLNVCDVSSKTHTTRFPVRVAFVCGNTQIIFVDTPGLVTKKEFSRFDLSESYRNWKNTVLKEVDLIGIIQDVPSAPYSSRFHSNVMTALADLDKSKDMFLILNKIDLVKNKRNLLKVANRMVEYDLLESQDDEKSPKKRMNFSKVFFTSALNSTGVDELVQYLLREAKIGDWIMEEGQISDSPMSAIIINLLRGKLLNLLPHEVPYSFTYEIEYLEENNFGEIICVALLTPKHARYKAYLITTEKRNLKVICQEIESDLYNIYKRVVKLRVVVRDPLLKKAKMLRPSHRSFSISFPR